MSQQGYDYSKIHQASVNFAEELSKAAKAAEIDVKKKMEGMSKEDRLKYGQALAQAKGLVDSKVNEVKDVGNKLSELFKKL